jgi:hypothetical protein
VDLFNIAIVRPEFNPNVVSFASVTCKILLNELLQVKCCPVDESLVTVVGDGFAKTFKYTDSSFKPVTTDVTNQEPHQVLCHVWLPPPSELVVKHKRNKSQDKGKEKGTSEHKDKDNEKDDNKNEKTTNEKADPLCCMYSLSSGELLYVEDGKVILYLTHFLESIFASSFKNSCTFCTPEFLVLVFLIFTSLEKKVRA